MCRIATILLYTYFVSFAGYSQQYPFVSYTTNDGLVSNHVSSIFQDSIGRLFFLTYNGLSIYDGVRFTNYASDEGLANELVNDVMQVNKDSFLIATNTNEINCLTHGRITKLVTSNNYCPIINQLYRDANNKLYAAADEGLFVFEKNHFKRLSFFNDKGKDEGFFISHICMLDNNLMLVQSLPAETNYAQTLYLYNYAVQKIIASIPALNFIEVPGGNFWVMTNNGIFELKTSELFKSKIHLNSLAGAYKKIASYKTGIVFFDKDENCWFAGKENHLTKCDRHGNITVFPSQNLLYERQANSIFQDKEGTLWFCFAQNGVSKLSVTNLSLLSNVYGLHYVNDVNYNNNTLLFYSAGERKIVLLKNSQAKTFFIKGRQNFSRIYFTAKGFFGIAPTEIYKLKEHGSALIPFKLQPDKNFLQGYGKACEDKNGNLIVVGNKYLMAVVDGKKIVNVPVDYFADEIAKDKYGNIWVANRLDELMKFSIHPEHRSQYLQLEKKYKNLLPQINVRSACFDSSGNLWIGSRYKGLFRLSFAGEKIKIQHLTKKQGLSDNFNSYLACDAEGNIWSCSPSGLDKISFNSNKIVVTNITQQSSLFQQINTLAFDGDTTAWVLNQTGNIIKITHQKQNNTAYKPKLFLANVRAGNDTLLNNIQLEFSYLNNGPSFYFGNTSFLNEHQTQYSYRLQGSNNNSWSTASTNAFINFINLAPGNYVLQTKAFYPASIYPDQIISVPFEITPPWWQTKWFRFSLVLIAAAVFFTAIRLYVRRKLERQRIALEKKQAVEKERTRIATDMHDDLGAGLSRIKFLSETISLKKQMQQPVEDDILKIRDYAHEMIDKMGEIIWALNEKNDSLNDLLSYTRVYTMEYLTQNEITCSITSPENLSSIFVTGEVRRNIFLTLKEALHNIVKHAKANNVYITINVDDDLSVCIADNGVGFSKNSVRSFSNGFYNMQKRIKEIGGTFEIKNDSGTVVSFTVPLQT